MRRQLAALVLALSLPWPAQAAEVVVRPGETLSEIAARAGISTQRLMQINGLRNADLIVAGQRLIVPGGSQPGTSGNRGGSPPARVTIRQGETLSEIALRYGVSVERLMQLNGLSDPSRVVAGETLVLRSPTSNRRSGGGAAGGTTVLVRPGETLSEIADRHNVTVERLIQLNGIQNPSQLMAGDRLVISSRPPARSSRAGTASGARVYVVQPGDTLSEISSDTRVPMQRLLSLNNLQDPDELTVGTRLKLTTPPPVPRTRPRTTTRPRPRVTTPTVARTPAPSSRTTTATSTDTFSTVPGSTTAGTTPARTGGTIPAASPGASNAQTAVPTTAAASSSAGASATTAADPGRTRAAETSTQTTSAASRSTPTTAAPSTAIAGRGTPTETTATTTPTQTTGTIAPARNRPTGATTGPARTALRTGARAGAVAPDWRTYGPLQVDWASWQSMGGSYVAPVLGGTGQPYYLAINCGARKLNTTAASGQWKTWESPRSESEETLVTDLCKLKGG